MRRLPHPEPSGIVNGIWRNVVGTRRAAFANIDIEYATFQRRPDTPDVGPYSGSGGTIDLPAELVAFDERFADLTAFHEQIEIERKLAGISHAAAHRRTYVGELLAARRLSGHRPSGARKSDAFTGSPLPAQQRPRPASLKEDTRILSMTNGHCKRLSRAGRDRKP